MTKKKTGIEPDRSSLGQPGAACSPLQRRIPSADAEGMRVPLVGRVVVVGVVAVAAVVGGGSGAWALSRHHSDGPPVPAYPTAAAMAATAGCARSFRLVRPPAGVQSAGWCVLDGSRVDLRVQRNINTANPWPSRSGGRVVPGGVGNGWLIHSDNVKALDLASARLAP